MDLPASSLALVCENYGIIFGIKDADMRKACGSIVAFHYVTATVATQNKLTHSALWCHTGYNIF